MGHATLDLFEGLRADTLAPDTAAVPSRLFSWNDIVFPRIDIRGLVFAVFADGRYSVAGVVVNTDGGGIVEAHDVEFYFEFYELPNRVNRVWTSPVWRFRVPPRSSRTIDERGHDPIIASHFSRFNHATCFSRKTD